MHTFWDRDVAPARPDERAGPTILAATLTVTIAALLSTIGRGYVRICMIKNMGWDDYVMYITMLLCIVGQCLVIPQVHLGAGRHIEYLQPHDISLGLKLNFVTQPIYLFAICLVKISVGFFLLRIAVKPFYKRLIIGIMVFMGIYTIGCFFTLVLQCTDLRILWDRTVHATCWTNKTLKTLSFVNSGLNILTDIAFSVLIPIPMLWSVQMNRRHKASVICILGLGVFATAAALVKLSYLPSYGHSGDWLWDSRNLTIWIVVECNIGIIAGNLPCMKPLFRTVLGSTYGRGSRKTTGQNYVTDPYGRGTNHRSDKNYASIHSTAKEAEGEFQGYGAAGKAYMLTTIDAKQEKRGSMSKVSSGRSSVGGDSTESIIGQSSKSHNMHSMGGIAVTTKVDVRESRNPNAQEVYGEATAQQRPEAKQMV